MDIKRIREEVRKRYQEVAISPGETFHLPIGADWARCLNYPQEAVREIPTQSVQSFCGVGNPLLLGPIRQGERVLDIGCGAGMDALIAARKVGPSGEVIGVDPTEEMLAKARASAAEMMLSQVEFRQGYAEELPLEDESVDVVISNGVFNLVPKKVQAFAEAQRVLRPGGRLLISDIVLQREPSGRARSDAKLWSK